jgi:hypothetical protein
VSTVDYVSSELPDPRARPTALYVCSERAALRSWNQSSGKVPVVRLQDLHDHKVGALPVSVPEASVWDGVEWYFHSVEELSSCGEGDAWVAAWGIEQYKQSHEYADLLARYGSR